MPLVYDLQGAPDGSAIRVWIATSTITDHLWKLDWQKAAANHPLSETSAFLDCDNGEHNLFGFGGVGSWHIEDNFAGLHVPLTLAHPDSEGAVHDWGDIARLSVTLGLLFTALRYQEGPSPPYAKQLLGIDTFVTKVGMRGGSFSVTFAPCLMEWLLQRSPTETWPEIEEPVKAAYNALTTDNSGNHYPWSWLNIHLDLPLGVSFKVPPGGGMLWMSHPWTPGQGAEFQTVDVDPLVSQILLLFLLGRLCSLYREEHPAY